MNGPRSRVPPSLLRRAVRRSMAGRRVKFTGNESIVPSMVVTMSDWPDSAKRGRLYIGGELVQREREGQLGRWQEKTITWVSSPDTPRTAAGSLRDNFGG